MCCAGTGVAFVIEGLFGLAGNLALITNYNPSGLVALCMCGPGITVRGGTLRCVWWPLKELASKFGEYKQAAGSHGRRAECWEGFINLLM